MWVFYYVGIFTAVLAAALPNLAQAQPAGRPAHFHHVHLNVTDPAKTIQFYTKYFGAVKIDYHDTSPALCTERSFLLLNKVDPPPAWEPHSALSHIGWAAVDGNDEVVDTLVQPGALDGGDLAGRVGAFEDHAGGVDLEDDALARARDQSTVEDLAALQHELVGRGGQAEQNDGTQAQQFHGGFLGG